MSFVRIIAFNHRDDAEEVFQRTCMVLWQNFSKFDGKDFAAWACRTAHFEMLKHRESKRRVKLLSDDTIEHLARAALPVSTEMGERRAALASCLKSLSDDDHSLIKQRYYDGMSVQEIADLIGRSTYAVYRELSRIHGALSRCIERRLVDES